MNGHTARFLSKTGGFDVGVGFQTRVMALLGTAPGHGLPSQIEKLEALASARSKPDIVADLSYTQHDDSPLWRRILSETSFVVATLPIYRCSRRNEFIDPAELAATAIEQMECGVGMITIHATPSRELVDLAGSRRVPWTSRGGGMVIRDLLAFSRSRNVYREVLPAIVATAKRTGTVISLGSTFRSANLFDACDAVHWREIETQIGIATDLTAEGVAVVIEGPGHAKPSDIRRLCVPLRRAGFPVMPLGPMPTDAGFDQDHVAASIGASLMGMEGCAHILAAVTREEHSGGVPSLTSTVEAVATACLAAHVIDLDLLGKDDQDRVAANDRAMHRTCVVDKQTRGCSRCSTLCPL